MIRGVICNGTSATLKSHLPNPKPQAGEVILKVRIAGICDTDIQLASGYMGFRGILGHEFVGETSDGRRVTADINFACHACKTCRDGEPGHCPHRTVLGILGHDGAMADMVCVPERNLHFIPEGIDDNEAIFIEPLAAALHISDAATLNSDTNVAILGDGKLGILCAWAAALQGSNVTLIGKHPEKLKVVGAGVKTILSGNAAPLQKTFDVVVESTGSETGLPSAFNLVRPRGTVVLKTTIANGYQINLAPIVIDEIKVVGSRCGAFAPAIKALQEKKVDVRKLIETQFSLNEAELAFDLARKKGTKKILLHI